MRLVKSVDAPGRLTVRYDLTGANDRELPLILALMPVLSRAHTDADAFRGPDLADPGRLRAPIASPRSSPANGWCSRRDPDYWARDLPITRGLYNFDEIRIDYYRDATAMFEAFKAGLYDFRIEDDPTRWRGGYDFPAARDGRVVEQAVPNGLPKGVAGFAFNTRRADFRRPAGARGAGDDVRFRMDQRQSLRRRLQRSKGFFDDSELSVGRPAGLARGARAARALSRRGARRRDGGPLGAAGLRRLGPRPRAGAQRARAARRGRLRAAATARWSTRAARRSPSKSWSGTARRSGSRSPMPRNLRAHRRRRRRCAWSTKCSSSAAARSFDFDMMIGSWIASPSPGNEQRGRWGSAAADDGRRLQHLRRGLARRSTR